MSPVACCVAKPLAPFASDTLPHQGSQQAHVVDVVARAVVAVAGAAPASHDVRLRIISVFWIAAIAGCHRACRVGCH